MEKTTYKRAFDSVSAPENAADRVLARVSPRPRPLVRRTALILAAALALTCGAAFASGIAGDWMDALIRLGGRSVPDGNIRTVNQTVVDNGICMTLTDVVSDGMNAWLLIDMEAMKGQDFTPSDTLPVSESLYVSDEILLQPNTSVGFAFDRLDDGSDPARARIALKYSFSESQLGEKIALTITALQRGSDVEIDGALHRTFETLAEGEWSFLVRLPSGAEIVRHVIDDWTISVTALGLTIDGIGDPALLDNPPVLRLADGTEVSLTSGSVHRLLHNDETTFCSYQAVFSEMIAPQQATALIIDDQEYPLG